MRYSHLSRLPGHSFLSEAWAGFLESGIRSERAEGYVSNALLMLVTVIIAFVVFAFHDPSMKLVLAVVAFAVFFIAFLNMSFALVILIFAMQLSPELSLGSTPGRAIVVRVEDILLIVVFTAWLARTALHKELGILRKTRLNAPILAYIAVCAISTTLGGVLGTTDVRRGVFYVGKYFEYFLLFFMVSNSLRTRKQAVVFVTCMMVTCMVVGIYSTAESFATGDRATTLFEGAEGEPATLAGYLIIMMSVMLALFLHLSTFKIRAVLAACFSFLVIPLLYSLSRGGWMGFVPMYLTSAFVSKRGKEVLILLLAIAVIAGPSIMPQKIISRAASTFVKGQLETKYKGRVPLDDSSVARLVSWAESVNMTSRQPLIGLGVATGGPVTDNQYGLILRETGVLGVAAFIWLVVVLLRTCWRSYRDPRLDEFGRGVSLGLFSAIIGLLTMGATAAVFIIIRIMEPFWFLAAIVAVLPDVMASEITQTVSLPVGPNVQSMQATGINRGPDGHRAPAQGEQNK
jgi:hypothetical protein